MISLDSPPVYTIALLGPKNSTFEADFFRTDIRGASRAMVPCPEQLYAGFRLKLCQIETPSKAGIRSSQCGINNLNMA